MAAMPPQPHQMAAMAQHMAAAEGQDPAHMASQQAVAHQMAMMAGGAGYQLQGLPQAPMGEGMDGTPGSAGANRFKPSQKQREDLELVSRNGQYTRKCKELEDYAKNEGLPYKAVLSWFDRNKARMMEADRITAASTAGDQQAIQQAAQMAQNTTPQRFKPTQEQIQGRSTPPNII